MGKGRGTSLGSSDSFSEEVSTRTSSKFSATSSGGGFGAADGLGVSVRREYSYEDGLVVECLGRLLDLSSMGRGVLPVASLSFAARRWVEVGLLACFCA